jgi:hypothetical protein
MRSATDLVSVHASSSDVQPSSGDVGDDHRYAITSLECAVDCSERALIYLMDNPGGALAELAVARVRRSSAEVRAILEWLEAQPDPAGTEERAAPAPAYTAFRFLHRARERPVSGERRG